MNPFEAIVAELHSQPPLHFDIGEFRVDASELLTDDLAHIFIYFKSDKKMVKDLVKYVEQLPYSLKLDMMFYLGKNKSDYNDLLKIKSFRKMIDGFASSIADIKLQ